jgi:hypothetical protein
VASSELPSQKGRAQSRGTHGSTDAHLSKEARSEVKEHVVAPELTSVRRRGTRPRDTWQRRSSPQYGGEVRAVGHMTTPEPTSAGRCGPKLQLM